MKRESYIINDRVASVCNMQWWYSVHENHIFHKGSGFDPGANTLHMTHLRAPEIPVTKLMVSFLFTDQAVSFQGSDKVNRRSENHASLVIV